METRTSCDRLSHPFASRIFWWSLANCPCFSVFQKTRAHDRMKLSWNILWWKDLAQPRRSMASSAPLHFLILLNPSLTSDVAALR